LFESINTLEELKRIYRKASKFLHPDMGGDNELMSLLTMSYEIKKQAFEFDYFSKVKKEKNKTYSNSKSFQVVKKGDKKIVFLERCFENEELLSQSEKKFIHSLIQWLESEGFLTQKQFDVIKDIYNRKLSDKYGDSCE